MCSALAQPAGSPLPRRAVPRNGESRDHTDGFVPGSLPAGTCRACVGAGGARGTNFRPPVLALALLTCAVMTLGATGCEPSRIGETCGLNSDCEEGLICREADLLEDGEIHSVRFCTKSCALGTGEDCDTLFDEPECIECSGLFRCCADANKVPECDGSDCSE